MRLMVADVGHFQSVAAGKLLLNRYVPFVNERITEVLRHAAKTNAGSRQRSGDSSTTWSTRTANY